MGQGWVAKESFVVGEVPNARGATPDKLDPFTVAFLAACQGLAELIGNEGVTQLVRSVRAELRQATALLTSNAEIRYARHLRRAGQANHRRRSPAP